MVINSLPKGTLLRGGEHDYRIERVLGSGSFGITYLASYQDRSGVVVYVALKEFFMNEINGREGTSVTTGSKDGLFADYRRKFAREAKNLTTLDHPNIIKVMEYFECNNTSYYTMEYLEGGSLDDYIKLQGALPEKQTLQFASQIGEALSYMHSQGMLHLDLKPKNIMMRGDGSLALIDFGLAKQYDASGNPESSTKVGGGTPGYAPIEQADYHEGKGFPVTMDIYAFGATMFKMLTTSTPPPASEILNNGLPAALLLSNGITSQVIEVVTKAMSPMRKDRYDSVSGMLGQIGLLLSEKEQGRGFVVDGSDSRILSSDGAHRRQIHDTSRSGEMTEKELRRFNWGAFVFGWIWGIFNGVTVFLHELWLFVLLIITVFAAWATNGMRLYVWAFFVVVGIVVKIYFGRVGTRLAWTTKPDRWSSKVVFKNVQQTWGIFGILLFATMAIMIIAGVIVAFIY